MTVNIRRLIAGACLHCSTFIFQVAFADTNAWNYTVTPYLWNVNFDGNTSSGGNGVPVDTDYSFFTLENLDSALFLTFEANNGRYGILLEGLRARYSDSTTDALLNTQLAVELGFIEAAVSYLPSRFEHLDFLAGARYLFLDTQLVLTPGPTSDSDHSWLDPLLGVRYQNSIANN